MFYHASLLFDYLGFVQDATVLASAVDQGNLIPLYRRASEIANHTSPEAFVLRAYGEPLRVPHPVAEVETSPFRNSYIGEWLIIVMSLYVQPNPRSIGYNWGILKTGLERLNWAEQEVAKLFDGLPTGLLVRPTAVRNKRDVLKHEDPYWMWIRPDYSYNQGGWLPVEECERLLAALQQAEPQIRALEFLEQFRLTKDQNDYWKRSLWQGHQDALDMLAAAIRVKQGLYMVILWDWDDDDAQDVDGETVPALD